MRHPLPALALMGLLSFTLSAEDMDTPPPLVPPAPPIASGPALVAPAGGPDRRALMKEMMELDAHIRPIREKVQQDPELLKLKIAADESRKAVRAKEDELMSADPVFVELKPKRDALIEKMTAAGMDPNRPGRKDKEGKPGGPNGPGPRVPPPAAPKL